MKKKIFSYLLIAAMGVSLVACSGKAEGAKDNGTVQEEQLGDIKDSNETDEPKEPANQTDGQGEETKVEPELEPEAEKINNKESESEKEDSKLQATSKKDSNTAQKPAVIKQLSSSKPTTTKPSTTKPNTTKPNTTKPNTTKPNTTKPNTTKPSTTKPNTTKPTTTKPVKKVTLASIHKAVKKAYGDNYIPSMAYDKTALEEQFGIKSDWYTNIIAEGPMMSTNVDTFIAVQANKNNVNDVVKALEQYRDRLINETLQYPMNLPKINASQVLKIDNKVFFIMLGVIPDDTKDTEEALLKAAKAQNQIAVKAIKKAMK